MDRKLIWKERCNLQLPAAFIEKYQHLLGAEAPAFLATFDQPSQSGFRTNPLKNGQPTASIAAASGPTTHVKNGWFGKVNGKSLDHVTGWVYSQEPSAMTVGEVVAPQPGERVLDLCAAPGVSGAEHSAAELAAAELAPFGQVKIDPLGSVTACFGPEDAEEHVLLDAHLDQIGLTVSSIDENGFLSVKHCGGVDARILPGAPVVVCGKEQITGSLTCAPQHLAGARKQRQVLEARSVVVGHDAGIGVAAARLARLGVEGRAERQKLLGTEGEHG